MTFNTFFKYSVVLFLSRIVLGRLTSDSKEYFRKLEKTFKANIKINADLRFFYNFCLDIVM